MIFQHLLLSIRTLIPAPSTWTSEAFIETERNGSNMSSCPSRFPPVPWFPDIPKWMTTIQKENIIYLLPTRKWRNVEDNLQSIVGK